MSESGFGRMTHHMTNTFAYTTFYKFSARPTVLSDKQPQLLTWLSG